ncbi:MAG: zinc-binding dehydrogenase, partial [Rhodothermales bacterium]|nr:zinc-binding dehydrogenase [Rhodothermales bacterium]
RGLCGYMSYPFNTERPDVYRADLTELMRLLRDGDLDPVIGARFPLDEIGRAHEMLNASGTVGKIVVECTPAEGA